MIFSSHCVSHSLLMTGNDFQKMMTTTMKTVKVISNDSHNSELWFIDHKLLEENKRKVLSALPTNLDK